MLLVLPVIYVTALAHRCLQLCAPSNVWARHVRTAVPRWRTAAALLGASLALVAVAHGLDAAVEDGAPQWWNLMALVAAWDAIKFGLLAVATLMRCARAAVGGAFSPRLTPGGRSHLALRSQ
jgi:hypothetical protein